MSSLLLTCLLQASIKNSNNTFEHAATPPVCRPGERRGSCGPAAPAPTSRVYNRVSAPEETHHSWLGWVFIKGNTYGVVLPLIRSLHFWSPVASSAQRGGGPTGSRGPSPPTPTGNLYIVFLCFVCVRLIFKRWNSVTILNQGRLSCLKNRRENSPDVEVGPQVRLEKSRLSGKPLDPPFIHAVREETRCFIDAPLRYIVSSGPECLLTGVGGEVGGRVGPSSENCMHVNCVLPSKWWG